MNAALLQQLEALIARDQETRQRLLASGRLYGGYDETMQTIHSENARSLDALYCTRSRKR